MRTWETLFKIFLSSLNIGILVPWRLVPSRIWQSFEKKRSFKFCKLIRADPVGSGSFLENYGSGSLFKFQVECCFRIPGGQGGDLSRLLWRLLPDGRPRHAGRGRILLVQVPQRWPHHLFRLQNRTFWGWISGCYKEMSSVFADQ